MTPKLSVLLFGATATASNLSATTQEWYAASQAQHVFATIQRNLLGGDVQPSFSSLSRHLSSTFQAASSARKSKFFTKLQKSQPPSANDILDGLYDEYDKFWIEVKPVADTRSGPCVWSECAIDTTSDEYTGDNRDGDSQWYQFRTQPFCANAAYTLYGRKKGDIMGAWKSCSERHFINSFFTYGGSDNLLKAVGTTPHVAYSKYGASSNADCVESQSGDADYSTVGCTAQGDYIIGYFDANTCDGNYFIKGSSALPDGSSFSKYTSAFSAIKCHAMDAVNDKTALTTLLSNSWACDVALYRMQCPDPYQLKAFYNFAIQTVINGGNPVRAYNQLVWRNEIRLVSWMLLLASALILFMAFSIKVCVLKRKPGSKPSSFEEDDVAPSSLMLGKTKIALSDGGKTRKVLHNVSSKTLAAYARVFDGVEKLNSQLRGKKQEERTFQNSSSSTPRKATSPQENSDGGGYASPSYANPRELERSTTPSTARHELNACETDESQEVDFVDIGTEDVVSDTVEKEPEVVRTQSFIKKFLSSTPKVKSPMKTNSPSSPVTTNSPSEGPRRTIM